MPFVKGYKLLFINPHFASDDTPCDIDPYWLSLTGHISGDQMGHVKGSCKGIYKGQVKGHIKGNLTGN